MCSLCVTITTDKFTLCDLFLERFGAKRSSLLRNTELLITTNVIELHYVVRVLLITIYTRTSFFDGIQLTPEFVLSLINTLNLFLMIFVWHHCVFYHSITTSATERCYLELLAGVVGIEPTHNALEVSSPNLGTFTPINWCPESASNRRASD